VVPAVVISNIEGEGVASERPEENALHLFLFPLGRTATLN
jgi:hypothetical protein